MCVWGGGGVGESDRRIMHTGGGDGGGCLSCWEKSQIIKFSYFQRRFEVLRLFVELLFKVCYFSQNQVS